MAKHNEVGKMGETLAVAWFLHNDYVILHQNWRHKNLEVDIIAHKHGLLHFIEVKCRTTSKYGHPEESVNSRKIKHLINASEEFLYQYPQWQKIQFDVLSITLHKNEETDYFLIEDVYE